MRPRRSRRRRPTRFGRFSSSPRDPRRTNGAWFRCRIDQTLHRNHAPCFFGALSTLGAGPKTEAMVCGCWNSREYRKSERPDWGDFHSRCGGSSGASGMALRKAEPRLVSGSSVGTTGIRWYVRVIIFPTYLAWTRSAGIGWARPTRERGMATSGDGSWNTTEAGMRLSRRDALRGLGGAGLALTGVGALPNAAPAAQNPDRPNILVILVDEMRDWQWFPEQDALNEAFPNLARLQQNAVRFGRHYTAANMCTPARGALLTGLYTHQTGLVLTQGGNVDDLRGPGPDGGDAATPDATPVDATQPPYPALDPPNLGHHAAGARVRDLVVGKMASQRCLVRYGTVRFFRWHLSISEWWTGRRHGRRSRHCRSGGGMVRGPGRSWAMVHDGQFRQSARYPVVPALDPQYRGAERSAVPVHGSPTELRDGRRSCPAAQTPPSACRVDGIDAGFRGCSASGSWVRASLDRDARSLPPTPRISRPGNRTGARCAGGPPRGGREHDRGLHVRPW